jgi:Tol biopolymer transport system component
LVDGDTNQSDDIFVHDRQTGQTTRVSVASDGTEGNAGSTSPDFSANGRYVAFASEAENLVSSDVNGSRDIFVHDRQTGETSLISVNSDGDQAKSGSAAPSISADGRYVAFSSSATNLVEDDLNFSGDVFVHDRQTEQTSRISVATDGTEANNGAGSPSISADGRYITFQSNASNLVSGDTNSSRDIFLHDRQSGETIRISVASDGTEGNEASSDGVISADGQYIAFYSEANNLVHADTNNDTDIFIHHIETGETSRVSLSHDNLPANGNSYSPGISNDGRYVSFFSYANNLVGGDTNSMSDTFVRDSAFNESP